jgi:ATP-dependent Clp protease ATP-binding subunit ClpC
VFYYDLKIEAKRKAISNVVARDTEIKRIARTMQRQYNNNCLIRGESGTGKTALLEAFAYQISKGVLNGFESCLLVKLDTTNLKKTFGGLTNPETATYLITAFRNLPENTIVFIDDFENIIVENKFSEFNQIFEPFFDRADLKLFITISEPRYIKLHEENPSFFQNFEQINLKESATKETEEILAALSPSFEKEYSIAVPKDTVKNVVNLSQKIASDKKSPLRAIHLLDEALAFAKISGAKTLDKKHVQEIFSEKTGIPSATLNSTDSSLLKNLDVEIKKNVVGQDNAIKIIADIVRRGRMGLRNPNRPTGSFLFLGPSGVGKTELSKVLAKTVYGSERAFTRIDMSEFGEQHTVQRLIGAPPGYVGFEAGGQLTNSIAEQPYSLILLDEIEKAHSKIFDIFLQVFDDGRLTDGQGKTISFTNSIVIATSNLGIEEIADGFKNNIDVNSPEYLENTLMPILMKNFRTEFLNRFDAIIVFNPLGIEDLIKIAMLEIKKIEERTKDHNIKFNIDPNVLRTKIVQIADPRFGARPVKRFIETTCEGLIAAKLLEQGQS